MTPQMEEQMMAGILAYRIEVRQLQQERDRKRKELEEQRKHSEETLLLLERTKLREEIAKLQREIAGQVAATSANVRMAIRQRIGGLVLAAVSKEFGVSPEELIGPCRQARLSLPRSVVALLLQERGWSLLKTGRLLNRHHTSIMYAVEAVRRKMVTVPGLGNLIAKLRVEIDAKWEGTWDVQ